jgi:alpha-tubulin suppressor-like RCC1 family protein
VSVSELHTCAVSGTSLRCWGDNQSGQLGVGVGSAQLPPTELAMQGWRSVQTGTSHSCGLTLPGQVYCWGDGSRGQLGQGDRSASPVPRLVPLAAPAVAVSTGWHHTCALLDDGAIWCWGDNNEGQLGQDDIFPGPESRDNDAVSPVRVPAPARADAGSSAWASVDVGEGHTCAVLTDDSLWCWGRNSQAQLGTTTLEAQERRPIQVTADRRWLRVDASQNYTCALDAEGSLWFWGYNMGIRSDAGNPFGSVEQELRVPTRSNSGPWLDVSSNMFHTCAIDRASDLWCWGRSTEGQLGLTDETVQVVPVLVASGVASVSAGTYSTCYISLAGELFCAGKNSSGQVGAGSGSTETHFLLVPLTTAGADAG